MSFLNNLATTNGTAIGVGPSGSTNPVFAVDCSQSSAAAGVKVTGNAAASGADISVVSSGTNENLTINAKGSGTIALNPTGTGNVITTRPVVVTSASANALAIGLAGTTNPALVVDASTGSSATGIKVKSAAAAAGVALSVVSSGTNENLTIDAKGSGTITLGGTSTGNIVATRAIAGALGITSNGATAGVGYATGAGGAVTQASTRTTGVTLNTICGAITLVSAAGSATPATFTVTNSAVAATDVVHVCQKSGTDLYNLQVTNVAAGSFKITYFTTGGTTTEQPVFNFAIIKAVAA